MNQYLVVFLVVLCVVSATTLLLNYDDSLPNGVLSKIAHYFRYIESGFKQ